MQRYTLEIGEAFIWLLSGLLGFIAVIGHLIGAVVTLTLKMILVAILYTVMCLGYIWGRLYMAFIEGGDRAYDHVMGPDAKD